MTFAPTFGRKRVIPVARPEVSAVRQEIRYRPRYELDLRATIAGLRRGAGDPTMTIAGGVIWRATLTLDGVATLALRQKGDEVLAAAWGPGAQSALAQVPRLCGADDDATGFDSGLHPLIAESSRRHPGLRLAATDQIPDALISAILEQKVTGMQAFGAWKYLTMRFGTVAPGPTPKMMFAAPDLDAWRRVPSWAWHRAGVEPPQSRTAVEAARRGDKLVSSLAGARDGDARERILTSLRGIGPWTSAEVRIRAFGDPDAVSVGDYHLAHHVGYALTGKRVDDDGMLELLQPWEGQRQRVIRLIMASGVTEPRRGARLHPEDHRER